MRFIGQIEEEDARDQPLTFAKFLRYIPALKTFTSNRCPRLLQETAWLGRALRQVRKDRMFISNPFDFFETPRRSEARSSMPISKGLGLNSTGNSKQVNCHILYNNNLRACWRGCRGSSDWGTRGISKRISESIAKGKGQPSSGCAPRFQNPVVLNNQPKQPKKKPAVSRGRTIEIERRQLEALPHQGTTPRTTPTPKGRDNPDPKDNRLRWKKSSEWRCTYRFSLCSIKTPTRQALLEDAPWRREPEPARDIEVEQPVEEGAASGAPDLREEVPTGEPQHLDTPTVPWKSLLRMASCLCRL